MIHTEETKKALSVARTGKNNPFYGKKHTQAAKDKMSKWSKNYNSTRQYDLRPLSIKIPTGRDLSYLAGIIDGEGSIRFRKGRPYIAVYNCSRLLMNWLQSIGGSVRDSDKRGRTVNYQWTITAINDVYWLTIALWDYLIVKQDDATIILNHIKEKYGNRIQNTMDKRDC